MRGSALRLGVIGLGRAFTLMLPTFLAEQRVRLVAACDPREAARARFKADFGAPVYAEVAEMVRDPEVDVVYVASPHQFHAEHVELAAAAGKHVLVEKPMALSREECDAMIRACQAAGVALVVGHCHSFDTPYLQTRKLIESGLYGDVRMIQALNYTDFLYRPRRPEELRTEDGGGVVFSQAAHQVDVVRLLAGSGVSRVRSVLGRWDPERPTEGAYGALLWFESGAFANLSYSGYGHFDSDEWCEGIGEMGQAKAPDSYGSARRRLQQIGSMEAEASLKADSTYGGARYQAAARTPAQAHQHFGPIIVCCEHADLRPLPDRVLVYGDAKMSSIDLPLGPSPRFEVIDELEAAVRGERAPIHDGKWARDTLIVCLAILQSAGSMEEITLR